MTIFARCMAVLARSMALLVHVGGGVNLLSTEAPAPPSGPLSAPLPLLQPPPLLLLLLALAPRCPLEEEVPVRLIPDSPDRRKENWSSMLAIWTLKPSAFWALCVAEE